MKIKFKISSILILLIFLLFYGINAKENLLNINSIIGFKIITEIAISPDGQKIAYCERGTNFKSSKYYKNIFIVDLKNNNNLQFTYGEQNIHKIKWAPDNKYISYLSDRCSENCKRKEENISDQLWLIRIDGGESFELTKFNRPVLDYVWSPDSKNIYVLTEEEKGKVEIEWDKESKDIKSDRTIEDEEKYRKQIWIFNVEEKNGKKLYEGDYGISEIAISPNGKYIAYSTNYTGEEDHWYKYDIWLLDISAAKARQLTKSPGGETNPIWNSDSNSIIYLVHQEPDKHYSQNELFIIELKNGEAKNLTIDFDKNIVKAISPVKGKNIYFSAEDGVYDRIYKLEINSGSIKNLTLDDYHYYDFDVNNEESSFAFLKGDSDELPEVYISDKALKQMKKITKENDQLKNYKIASQSIVRYKSFDGKIIEALLVKPVNYEEGKKYPLLLYIHGGPFGRFTNTMLQYLPFQAFAAEGYMIIAPNYRGSSGYDNEFGLALYQNFGEKDYEDLMSSVDYLIREGLADENRLGVIGGSYGGYMTNWIVTHTNKFKAAVSLFGIYSLISDFSNSYLPNWEIEYLGYKYWENLKIYLEKSPMSYIQNINTPVLIIHGEADQNTFISNSKELYQALKFLQKPAKFIHYPREEHGLREPNHKIDEFNNIISWFDKYLKYDGSYIKYRLGETISKDNLKLTVYSISKIKEIAGVKPQGRFIKIGIILKQDESIDAAYSFHITDKSSDIYLIDEGGNKYYPIGFPQNTLSSEVVIYSKESSIVFNFDKSKPDKSIAFTLLFDVPEEIKKLELKFSKFPSIILPIH